MSADKVVVEVLDGYGRVQWRERLVLNENRRTFTIGRSIHADVTLDDPFAAEMHASLEVTPDGRIFANDLGSMNGLTICGKRLRGTCDFEILIMYYKLGERVYGCALRPNSLSLKGLISRARHR